MLPTVAKKEKKRSAEHAKSRLDFKPVTFGLETGVRPLNCMIESLRKRLNVICLLHFDRDMLLTEKWTVNK